MIARKLFSTLNLTRTQAFCVYKTVKIVVIGKKENFMLANF